MASVAGQAFGVVGVVVCLVLIVGVLLGRGWAIDQVDTVSATAIADLAKAEPILVTVSQRVSDVDARLGALADAAAAIAASDSPAPALVSALSDRISGVSERYVPLRARYAEAREKIVSMIDRLQTLDRIVPGISIPQGPVDALMELDARVQELDSTVMGVIGAGGVVESVKAAAQGISDKITQAEAVLDRVTAAIAATEVRLGELKARVAMAADNAITLINVVSLVLILLLAYIAVLHAVLFRWSGGMRRGPAEG